MKFNLKNRVRVLPRILSGADLEICYDKTLDWFEGFEKELRERFAEANREPEFDERLRLKTVLIKEILGE